MNLHAQQFLLLGTVVAVGVLHTIVPDHWLPIALWARQSHWSKMQTARAALVAGFGHTLSTLAIGVLVWFAGLALAVRYGNVASTISSLALIAFGLWIVVASLREVREEGGHEGHHHADRPNARITLLLILGSSPMVEGIPAFFAAARFGVPLLALMAALFAASTMVTYVLLCVYAGAALQRVTLGRFERYGEVLSGAVVAVVGLVFLLWPIA